MLGQFNVDRNKTCMQCNGVSFLLQFRYRNLEFLAKNKFNAINGHCSSKTYDFLHAVSMGDHSYAQKAEA